MSPSKALTNRSIIGIEESRKWGGGVSPELVTGGERGLGYSHYVLAHFVLKCACVKGPDLLSGLSLFAGFVLFQKPRDPKAAWKNGNRAGSLVSAYRGCARESAANLLPGGMPPETHTLSPGRHSRRIKCRSRLSAGKGGGVSRADLALQVLEFGFPAWNPTSTHPGSPHLSVVGAVRFELTTF